MDLRRLHWMGCMMLVLLAGACSDPVPRVVEEDKDAVLRFKGLKMEENVRRGADLGVRVWAQALDGRGDPEPFHLRFSLRDSAGKPHTGTFMVMGRTLQVIRDGETFCWEWEPALVPGQVRKFDVPDDDAPPRVEFFLPYHWLDLEPGHHRLLLDMEAAEGEVPESGEEGFDARWEESRARERLGYMRVELEADIPQLYPVRVRVSHLELADDEFDPHEMDLSLFKASPEHGYPDLFWSLGIGYENVYNSDYFRNSLAGSWPEGTGVVYVRGPDEAVSLCAVDWDDERVFNNRHDQIGCWEGALDELSSDSAAPSVLSFHHVRRMDVYVEWLSD